MSSSIQICKLQVNTNSRFAEKFRCSHKICVGKSYALLLNSRLSESIWTNFTYENSPNNDINFSCENVQQNFTWQNLDNFNGPFSRNMIMRFQSYQHRKSRKVIFLFSDCCLSIYLFLQVALLVSFRVLALGYVTLGSELLKKTICGNESDFT